MDDKTNQDNDLARMDTPADPATDPPRLSTGDALREFKITTHSGEWHFQRDKPMTYEEIVGFLETQIGIGQAGYFEKLHGEWVHLMDVQIDQRSMEMDLEDIGFWRDALPALLHAFESDLKQNHVHCLAKRLPLPNVNIPALKGSMKAEYAGDIRVLAASRPETIVVAETGETIYTGKMLHLLRVDALVAHDYVQ